ncbi:molybdopterin converting factor subunit 1 [Glaciimonas immobilis]|uniref:Molybdopterin synthase sulfur carrier subunit n=1 Tax=Glaciimonas immobilis TaxID=728004 RepID=A0A840RNX6_9BURK|nr:molybdopterin converting factor subunit 1 [Glaciimonas immobilis]KAF3998934.1 molybdopterin converting factor subunit 1 [Glaciimonas immobilis]MBB5198341.1 molybdopterin synthase sulfur carrier subunit [Glaciimonas immobilis]
MKIQIRFFASVREALNLTQETVELPDTVLTVGDVRTYLRARGGVWEQVLGEGRALRMAYNQIMTTPEQPLSVDCEVAFFPPVTGG